MLGEDHDLTLFGTLKFLDVNGWSVKCNVETKAFYVT